MEQYLCDEAHSAPGAHVFCRGRAPSLLSRFENLVLLHRFASFVANDLANSFCPIIPCGVSAVSSLRCLAGAVRFSPLFCSISRYILAPARQIESYLHLLTTLKVEINGFFVSDFNLNVLILRSLICILMHCYATILCMEID